MKPCILCGKQTEGSIGAAGYFWSFICQPCKDKEDNDLAVRLEVMSRTLKRVTESFCQEEAEGL